jgi:hypothetical protein
MMTQQRPPVRFITRPGESFDHYIRDQVDQAGFGQEMFYFGITDPGRAEAVRRGLRRAGKRLGVAVKAYTADCPGCRDGGPGCRYHVLFTSYDMAAARDYMRRKAAALQWGPPR